MNVFACHPDPDVSATWLADQHVIKMTLETAQILSTALITKGMNISGLYRPTHRHHPCIVSCADPDYFCWVALHGVALGTEYFIRFGKTHASADVIQIALEASHLTLRTPTAWPLAMPDIYKQENPHAAYRSYLHAKYGEWHQRGGRIAPRWGRIVPDNPFVR